MEMENKKRIIESNQVTICGKIATAFKFSHSMCGEDFFLCDLEVQRLSDTVDMIPLMVSERLFPVKENYIGQEICVNGQFRSHSQHIEKVKTHLLLYVFAREITFIDKENNVNVNKILLDGYICKPPVYRMTPLGRKIGDVLLAVNRPYHKSDYIPCVFWGRNAEFIKNQMVGQHIKIDGRIQSRNYQKYVDGKPSVRTAYEISVLTFEVVYDENEKVCINV